MYLNSKYIGEPQKIEFPMYLKSEFFENTSEIENTF